MSIGKRREKTEVESNKYLYTGEESRLQVTLEINRFR